MYDIFLSDKAKKELKNFPKNIKGRMGNVFERIKIRPFHFVKPKQGTSYYVLRIGDYRAILDIQVDKKIIFVLEVGHRKNIYKK